jgi:hypothetical protein
MRLEACWFRGAATHTPWPTLARVLEASAARHCPSWERSIRGVTPDRVRGFYSQFVENTQKLHYWIERACASPDGTELLLIDVDTVILRPLDDIWTRAFDVAYTVRPHGDRFPFNGGVLFLRLSSRVRSALGVWREINARYLKDERPSWRCVFGGINQAAFAAMLETEAGCRLDMLRLPCAEWNCEESGWAAFDPDVTRILHVKGQLRRHLFHRSGATRPTLGLEAAAAAWRQAAAGVMANRRSA